MPCKRCCAAYRLSQQMLLSLILGADKHEGLMVLGMNEQFCTWTHEVRTRAIMRMCALGSRFVRFAGLVSAWSPAP